MSLRLSPRAYTFLRDCIGSLEELEIVLLLHKDATRWWSAEQISDALAVDVNVVGLALESLAGRNLLDVRLGESLSYCFAPLHPHFDVMLAEIASHPPMARELVMVCSPKVPRTPEA
jgi:hypothetical protein